MYLQILRSYNNLPDIFTKEDKLYKLSVEEIEVFYDGLRPELTKDK